MAARTSPLDDLRIASPCHADWSSMIGDDRARFCSECSRNVYDISAMSRSDAEQLIASAEGRICIRMYKRADGRVMTSDCSVGARRARQRNVRSARAAAALAIAVAGGFFGLNTARSSSVGDEQTPVVIELPPPPSPPSSDFIEMGVMVAPPDDTVAITAEPEPALLMGDTIIAVSDPEPLYVKQGMAVVDSFDVDVAHGDVIGGCGTGIVIEEPQPDIR